MSELFLIKMLNIIFSICRRSSRLDVATVQLVNSTDNECASSAEISAVSKSSLRKTSIIIAENKGLFLNKKSGVFT